MRQSLNIRFSESGISMVEFSFISALLVFIAAAFWNYWASEELKHNMVVAAYTTLNERVATGFRPFRHDPASGKQPHIPGSTVVVTGLKELGDLMINRISSASRVAKGSSKLSCSIELGYLNLSNGTAVSLASQSERVTVPSGNSTSTTLQAEMDQARSKYLASIGNRVLSGPTAKILLPGNSNPTLLYFDYSPFYIWGCEGEAFGLGNILSPTASVAEVLVPVA